MDINNHNNILISITLCTYNSERFLVKTINSVLNQTYKNIELIIVDDGSIDNTINILKDFKSKDNRIKIHLSKNYGLSNARNLSFNLSSGEWVGIIDHDDICNENRVEEIILLLNKFRNKNDNIGIIFSDTTYINIKEDIIGNHFSSFNFLVNYNNIIPKVVNSLLLLTKGCYIDSESVFFSKKAINEIGLMDKSLKYACDYDYFIKVGFHYDFLFTNQKLSQFRIHPNQQSSINPNRFNEIISVYKNYLHYNFSFKNKLSIIYVMLKIVITKYKTLYFNNFFKK